MRNTLGAYPNLYLDARPKAVDDRHETIHREPAEIRVAYPRKIGRGNAGSRVRGTNSQSFPVQRLHNLGRQDRSNLGYDPSGSRIQTSRKFRYFSAKSKPYPTTNSSGI